MSRIAARYGVRLSDLQAWNGVKSRINREKTYRYFKACAGTDCKVRYTKSGAVPLSNIGRLCLLHCKKGDTLWDISRKIEGVSLNDIMKLNGLTKSKILPERKSRLNRHNQHNLNLICSFNSLFEALSDCYLPPSFGQNIWSEQP